jgi:uncharacterized OB-fold protein
MDLARYHRLRNTYYRLEGQRCSACEQVQFPPAAFCRQCQQRKLTPMPLSGKGAVFSFAEVGQGPRGFPGPYLVAMIRLDEGPLVTAQLTDVDPEQVAIGLRVETVTRKLRETGPEGYLVYGYKFRPEMAAAEAR